MPDRAGASVGRARGSASAAGPGRAGGAGRTPPLAVAPAVACALLAILQAAAAPAAAQTSGGGPLASGDASVTALVLDTGMLAELAAFGWKAGAGAYDAGWGACSGLALGADGGGSGGACVCPEGPTCPGKGSGNVTVEAGWRLRTSSGALQVEHAFAPGPGRTIVADVTVTNLQAQAATSVLYRRGWAADLADLSAPAGAQGQRTLVSIGAAAPLPPALRFSVPAAGLWSDPSRDWLDPAFGVEPCPAQRGPGTSSRVTEVADAEAATCLAGATFELMLGDLAAGASASFRLVLGAAPNATAAQADLASAQAQWWATVRSPTPGSPVFYLAATRLPTPATLPPPDGDFDQVPDAIDNCPVHYNPTQNDADGDGRGDLCSPPPPPAQEPPQPPARQEPMVITGTATPAPPEPEPAATADVPDALPATSADTGRAIPGCDPCPATATTASGSLALTAPLALAGAAAAGGAATTAAFPRGRRWLAWVFVGLFSRVAGSAVLDHPRRKAVLEAIEAQPGIRQEDLCRLTGISRGAMYHHLNTLERNHLVRTVRPRGYVQCFPATAPGAAWADPDARRLLATLHGAPGITASRLATQAGVEHSQAQAYLRRLVSEGRVRIHEEHGMQRVYPVEGTNA